MDTLNKKSDILDYVIDSTILSNESECSIRLKSISHRDNMRSTTLVRIKKPKKYVLKSNNLIHKVKMERSFMIVKYDGECYSAYSIIESTHEEADLIADRLTSENNHKKHGYSAIPIHIPGTIPIMYLNLQTPIYYKNTQYYATMRSTYGGDTEFRAIALWKTEKEAVEFANISESMKNPKFIYTYIGGPVE